MLNTLKLITEAARGSRPVSAKVALAILKAPDSDLPAILAAASIVRTRRSGNRVTLCSIVNAKSGACAEDCAFCAQSARHHTSVKVFPLLSAPAIVAARNSAAKLPVQRFGVVTSGGTLGDAGIERLCRMIKADLKAGRRRSEWCASLGSLTVDQLSMLRRAGLRRFHHNLETAGSFFPKICSTHSYLERLKTVRAAKKAGLQICSGGILGMGESFAQRVEFAITLAREQVDSIPLNFLVPVAGTPLGHLKAMKPLDILRTIAMFRLVNPSAEVRLCAGRQHLGTLQPMAFMAGADSMMIGPMLTTPGCSAENDLKMIREMGLTPVTSSGSLRRTKNVRN